MKKSMDEYNKVITKDEYVFGMDKELKESFIQDMEITSSEPMMNMINNVMRKVDEYEVIIGRPIYNYTLEMYRDILGQFRASSISTLNSYFSVMKKYIEYTIDKRDGVNLDYRLITSQDMEKLLNQVAHEDRYITREQLMELISHAVNPQDMAIFVLLYEGVRGKDYNNLRLLKTKDIDFETGLVHLQDKDITIEDKISLSIIKEATRQIEYVKYVQNARNSVMTYAINPDNEYVIKNVVHKTDGLEPMASHRIKVKISDLASEMGREHLTGTTVYNSGLAERLFKSFNRHPDDISDKEMKQFLENNGEKIPCATLRRIARYILSK